VSQGFLLDRSIISILAPGRPSIPAALADWLRVRSDRLFLSAITVAEIEQGICKLRRVGGAAQAEMLSEWLDSLIRDYADRILLLDVKVGRLAGAMSDSATAAGRNLGFPDVAIAATASVHALVVLTRNTRHFSSLGISQADPFEELPGSF
jgi:predicted nucleic acid-binding protein